MRVAITDAAQVDLEDIGNFIAESNPLRAASFVTELLDRCAGLSTYPSRYPIFVTRQDLEIRRCPYRDYLIFYAIVGEVVEVQHIVHSARDYMRVIFPED
jgi:plasmid stabilization system protein ParE